MHRFGMTEQEEIEAEDGRVERRNKSRERGEYIDQFTYIPVTKEEALETLLRLPKCITEKRRNEMEELENAKALAKISEPDEFGLDISKIETRLAQIKAFQLLVQKNLIEGLDYGVIPGTKKPTLYKPGAEKIAKLISLADTFEVIDKIEDYEKPFFAYTIKCSLKTISTDKTISEGVGQCNSMESKYRWRWVYENKVPEHIEITTLPKQSKKARGGGQYFVYRIDNDDIYSQVNTIMKMAKKRALVDAALSAGRLSQIFTQDLEDLTGEEREQAEKASEDFERNPQQNEAAAEFEHKYNLGETSTSEEATPTQPESLRLTAIKQALIEKAVDASVLSSRRELEKEEKDALLNCIFQRLGWKWPTSKKDEDYCIAEIRLNDFLFAGKQTAESPGGKDAAAKEGDAGDSALKYDYICSRCEEKVTEEQLGKNKNQCPKCLCIGKLNKLA